MELPDIIKIKFEGGGVSPDAVRLGELARLLKLFEDYFVQQIRNAEPDTSREEIQLSLNSVRRSSASYGVVSSMPDATLSAFYQFGNAVANNDYVGLVPASRDLARGLVAFTRRHRCTAQIFSSIGRDFSVTVGPDTRVGGATIIRGETQFYGVLEKIGGAEPRFTLRVSEQEAIRGALKEDLAKELAGHLYSWVGISGVASWNPITGDVEDFRATGVLPYRGTGIKKAMELLRKAIGDYWDDDEEEVEASLQKIRNGEWP